MQSHLALRSPSRRVRIQSPSRPLNKIQSHLALRSPTGWESCFEAPRGQEETSIEVDVVGGLQSGPSFSPWQIRDAQGREAANAGVSLGEDDALGDFFAGVEKGVDFDAPVILEEAAKCQKHVIYDITFVR